MRFAQARENKRMDEILKKCNLGLVTKDRIKSRALKKAIGNRIAVVGFAVFLIIVIMCIGAPIFTKYDPLKIDLTSSMSPPSAEHILGTDSLGRDVFSRILYGGRISIFIGFGSAIGATLIGVTLGCWAGYKRGFLDGLFLRVSELFLFFPQIILVLLLVTMVGQSLYNIILIFMLTGWCSIFRMTRARMLSLKEEEYVQALKVLGLKDLKISFKHILPNAIGPIVVNVTLYTAIFILQESALSFMGLGVPMEIPTWGNILNAANDLSVIKENWWIWLPVGLVISLFVLSINFIGDGLRDSTDISQQG